MAVSIKNTVNVQKASGVEFVDLSDQPARAKIVRQGYDVPAVKLDAKRVDQFVGDLVLIPPKEVPRVVSQSIAAGTKVTAGTVVDLVLAPRTKIPFSIFDGVHVDLAAKTLDVLDPLVSDPAAKKALLSYGTADEVPAAEKEHLKTAFAGVGIGIDETNPAKSFAKAFETVRGGMAFQG